MTNSSNYIIDIAKKLNKPTNWVLINTEILWNTKYEDTERDVPLNYGEHTGNRKQPQDKSDLNIQASYGIPITNNYVNSGQDKLAAERWRYRYDYIYFDNDLGKEGYDNIWVPDPVELFEKVGKFRVNYKRMDNPFYDNVSLQDPLHT